MPKSRNLTDFRYQTSQQKAVGAVGAVGSSPEDGTYVCDLLDYTSTNIPNIIYIGPLPGTTINIRFSVCSSYCITTNY